MLTSFSEDARSRGDDPSVVWMMRSYANATDEEAAALEIPIATKVARLARVRLANGEPLAIEHAVVPAEFLPDLDDVGDSIYAAVQSSGVFRVYGTQRIRAALDRKDTRLHSSHKCATRMRYYDCKKKK